MKNLSKFTLLLFLSFLFLFFFLKQNTFAQGSGSCGKLNIACCEITERVHRRCDAGLVCHNDKCVKDSGSDSSDINYEDPNPIPEPIVGCDPRDIRDPEFHSLRPYQASPCAKQGPEGLFCGNEIVIKETPREQRRFSANKGCDPILESKSSDQPLYKNVDDGTDSDPKDYWIDISETEFPIAGNTEQVRNSTTNKDQFDDATKVNEYVSWYLNGVINRAEYGEEKNTNKELVDFSGPIQRLYPSQQLEALRVASTELASHEVTGRDSNGSPIGGSETHNQIVVCAEKELGGVLGKFVPKPCYENGEKTKYEEFRLVDVAGSEGWYGGDLNGFRTIVNTANDIATGVGNAILDIGDSIISNITGERFDLDIETVIVEPWNKRIPPLPWSDMDGKPFETDELYRKAYNEWKGKTCAILPIVGLICLDNPFVTNMWADLFPYVPLANTADSKDTMPIETLTIKPGNGTVIVGEYWLITENPSGTPVFNFAHAQETASLSEILNKTYLPSGMELAGDVDTKTSETNINNPGECRSVKIRSNEGDNLFPVKQPGDIGVEVYFEVHQLPLVSCRQVSDDSDEGYHWLGTYEGLVTLGIHTDPVRVPWGDQIWKTTIAGPTSTVRRIFPKIEKGAPIECLSDIPSETKASYKQVDVGNGLNGEIGVFSLQNPQQKFEPTDARLYFPHWGSIYDYFLKGIQTAIRPKGYGEKIVSGTLCENQEETVCGELPELLKASGSCSLGGVSSRVGDIPQSLKDIVEAASETYKVPPNLILGIMYGEGTFNPGRYDFSDENVKNWATCEPLPSCSSPETSMVPFISTYWDNLAEEILPDLQELDANTSSADPCNLLHATYGLANDLSHGKFGGSFGLNTCYGITLNTGGSSASGCSWQDSDYESAIKVWGSGYESMCFTKENSCATGGGSDAACPTGGDTCETISNQYTNPSHNRCVWDVAHGN